MAIQMAPEDTLRGAAHGEMPVLETLAQMNLNTLQRSGLDMRTYLLVRFAALAAMDAPPASYLLVLEIAEEAGVSVEDLKGALTAIAPIVGGPRVISAAAEALRAIGLAVEIAADSITD